MAQRRPEGTAPRPDSGVHSDRPSTQEVTRWLRRWSAGDAAARDRLMPAVFAQLKRVARAHFRGEPLDHTLQPTAVVNELYLRLLGRRSVRWENRAQFFTGAAEIMRHILVDHSRRRRAAKRGGGHVRVPLEEARGKARMVDEDLLALDEALSALARFDSRQAKVVELRFFVGLTVEEIADVLDISPRTVKRDFRTARAWLRREMARR